MVHTLEALLIEFGLSLLLILVNINIYSILGPTLWILPRLQSVFAGILPTASLLHLPIILQIIAMRKRPVIQI